MSIRPRYIYLLTFLLIFYPASKSLAADYKIFRTRYTAVYYSQEQHLGDLMWRVGGIRPEVQKEAGLAKNRIDRIVEQVEAILDMYPENFHIDIFLYQGYKEGSIAFYSHKTKSITVYVDRVTDGVLAHEIAHAIINSYFQIPPPKKVQEILTQYVDKYLWEEYRE